MITVHVLTLTYYGCCFDIFSAATPVEPFHALENGFMTDCVFGFCLRKRCLLNRSGSLLFCLALRQPSLAILCFVLDHLERWCYKFVRTYYQI
jgi:hypothetical protein